MSSKACINIKNKYDRVVVLVDMDCFYCQVEEKLNPEIRGKPIAVVQYNPWQGGGIIAVNYPARAKGVTRHMRGDEAKQHCPEIELPQVPQVRGKADISRYREAGKEVADVLKSFTPLLERASIDEAYLDITERVVTRIREMNEGKFHLLPDKLSNTFAVGYENIGQFVRKLSGTFDSSTAENSTSDKFEFNKSDLKLLVGASIVNEIRAAVKEKTGFDCSAGIAHNKILAKLTAGFHKPNKQTILPIDSIPKMYETLPLKKVKGLGGKLGDQVCEVLKITFMSELVQFPESLLQQHFDERMGSWMYLMARGIDLEAVTAKFHSKSIGCCKRFPGKNAITGLATLTHWLNELASEVMERLEKDLDENNRTAKQLTVSYSQQIENTDVASTRSIPLVVYDKERIAVDSLEAIKRNTERFFKLNSTTALNNAIKFLGISAGKFEPNAGGKSGRIKQMFQCYTSKKTNAEDISQAVPEAHKSEPLIEAQTKDKPTNESTSEASKPKRNIQHFLQNQASLVSTSKGEPNKSHPIKEIKVGEDLQHASTSGTVISRETVNQRKDMKYFIQQQRDKSVSSDTKNQCIEKHLDSNDKELYDATTPTINDNAPEQQQNDVKNAAEENNYQQNRQEEDQQEIVDDALPASEVVDKVEAPSCSYKTTYAEFYYNNPEPTAVTVECPQCRKQVPEYEFQSHQDFHFALSLSQQQRDEFRNDLKMKQMATSQDVNSPLNAKRTSKASATASRATSGSTNGTTSTAGPSITRFLEKIPATHRVERSEQEKDDQIMHHLIKCSECGELVEPQSITEHNDYHVAKRLQQELRRLEPPSPSVSSKPVVTLLTTNSSNASNNLKRKRPAVKEMMAEPNKQKHKSVSSFFTKL
ncbi:DNA polymerase eta [Anopheles nili]|uniref:DNA polymerase eta n=1 Tax=Anopheles nili TaxID=185578 RepID=UPI00237B679C|nr:DNA polymerase eta [Anopheles nili]